MKIIRNGNEYTLSKEEIEQACRENRHLLSIAEDQFMKFFQSIKSSAEFIAMFGFSVHDVCNLNSRHYLLEKFVVAFWDLIECKLPKLKRPAFSVNGTLLPEDDFWQKAICDVLIKNAVNCKMHYDARYVVYDVEHGGSILRCILDQKSLPYNSLDELNAQSAAYLTEKLEEIGYRNGNMVIRTNIKVIKQVGSGGSILEKWFPIRIGWDRSATIAEGKMQFTGDYVW